MEIIKQAEIEDLESSLLETQNQLEKLKDDFDIEKISKKEFEIKIQNLKMQLEKIQSDLDILEC